MSHLPPEPSVAVVIPTYRRDELVDRLLKSLFEGTRMPDEVVIVSNDPASRYRPSVDTQQPVRVIRTGLHLNVSAARNSGWRATQSDVCFFVDDDNVVGRDTVEAILAAFAAPGVGMVAPVIYEAERPSVVWCGGVRRSMWTSQTHFLHRGREYLPPYGLTWSTDDMPNSFAVPRYVLEDVGGFDETRFPFHYEEGDLAKRIEASGLRAIVIGGAAVWHSGGTSRDPGVEMLRALALNGPPRVQMMSFARVCFHRRYSSGVQKAVALTLFLPAWALLVSVACMRQKESCANRRAAVISLAMGLLKGYWAAL